MNVPMNPVETDKVCRNTLSRSVRDLTVATCAKTLKPATDMEISNAGTTYSQYFMTRQ